MVPGRDHIRVTVRAHPFVQGRKADPQIIRNLAPRKPAGQRYPPCLCPWFISFASQYVSKGAAQNRDRSNQDEAPQTLIQRRQQPRHQLRPRHQAVYQHMFFQRMRKRALHAQAIQRGDA